MIEKNSLIDTPLISVIIPTYNRKEMLLQAVQSVENQNYKNIEVIIIDDNSSDDTENFIKNNNKLNVTYRKNANNMGPGYSRKLGYSISSGEYIIFMDDDDYYTDFEFFSKAINNFYKYKHDKISFVSANSEIKYEYNNSFKKVKLNISGLVKQTDYLNEFQCKFYKPNSTFTTVFSKKELDNANFDNMEMVNDSSIYLRALLSGNAYIMDDFIGIYRIHNKNISSSIEDKFLVENLKEKRYVYEQIKAKKLSINLENWWYKQVNITVEYFITDTKPNWKSFLFVYKWCLNNTDKNKIKVKFSIAFLSKYIYIKLKQKLKKILRVKK